MKLEAVASTGIAAAAYDARARILRVRYPSGATYDYINVSPKTHAEFRHAESKGQFVNWRIKPFFKFRRVR